MSVSFRPGGHPFGIHRVVTPAGSLPQAADVLDASLPAYDDEMLLDVEKLVTGSAIRRSAEDRAGTVLPAQVGPAPPPPDATAAPDAAPPADAPAATQQQVREFLGTLAAHVRANSQDVGPRFAEEARKIHHGQAEGRAIRGTTTPEEEQALVDEEIPFARLPFLATDD